MSDYTAYYSYSVFISRLTDQTRNRFMSTESKKILMLLFPSVQSKPVMADLLDHSGTNGVFLSQVGRGTNTLTILTYQLLDKHLPHISLQLRCSQNKLGENIVK